MIGWVNVMVGLQVLAQLASADDMRAVLGEFSQLEYGPQVDTVREKDVWVEETFDAVMFRPPAIPVVTADPFFQTFIKGDTATSDHVSAWYMGQPREFVGLIRIDGETFRFMGKVTGKRVESLRQVKIDVGPTATTFWFEREGVRLRVEFLTTMFTDDNVRLSRPVYYVNLYVQVMSQQAKNISIYFDASGEHCTNNPKEEEVTWNSWTDEAFGVRIGTTKQNVLGLHGDRMNINWGYLFFGSHQNQEQVQFGGGPSLKSRRQFVEDGNLLSEQEGEARPAIRNARDKLVISCMMDLGLVSGEAERTFAMAYDDIESVYYYGKRFKGLWTQHYRSIGQAISDALKEWDTIRKKSIAHDKSLTETLLNKGGPKFAALARLIYRQTLAALKLVWHDEKKETWMFLKEISTNGDMNTMDVIFPASPFLLHANPSLLKALLVPVLEFANNSTFKPYWKPFSPHELGVYPIGNHSTFVQEPMPMENTGNMFLMMLGILHRDNKTNWFFPKYWNVLKSWADYLMTTLPFPESQLCTDDFQGLLANNTNLAAKGIVALDAFAEICKLVRPSGTNCDVYATGAKQFAETWVRLATTNYPMPHSKLTYGDHTNKTYSIKYNLVWQKILGLSTFPQDVLVNEVSFYLTKMHRYGVPLDNRNTNTKLDWLSWAATMASSDQDFHQLFDPIFRFSNETMFRAPLQDLYNVDIMFAIPTFKARPVCGAIYAKLLV